MRENRLGRTRAAAWKAAIAALATLATLTISCGEAAISDAGPATPSVEYVRQQEVLTPLPLRVRLPASYGAEHVVVLHKTWGSRGWTAMELTRAGQTWSGEISCRQVSTVTGDTRYFLLALNDDGQVVGSSGSPGWPHIATIVGSLPEGARTLPGEVLPERCHDPADCPPDFPGCPAYTVMRRSCRSNAQCDNDLCAWDGYCGSPSAPPGPRPGILTDEEELEMAMDAVKRRYAKGPSAAASP